MILGHAFLNSLIKRKGFFYRAVCLIGTYSLEIYLIYENIYTAGHGLFNSVDETGAIYALTIFTVSLGLSVLLKETVKALEDHYCQNRQN